ncbi:protein STPG4 [Lepisosteus oculatus]
MEIIWGIKLCCSVIYQTVRKELSERDGWWRSEIKDSPNPGSYHIKDFIEESRLNPVKITYSFKGSGRKYPVGVVRKGDFLLPGAYSLTNFVQQAEKRNATYCFKNSPRPNNFTLGIRDKDIDVSPCHYNVTEKPVVKLPCNHVMFRSAVQRLTFIPKEGPAPGQYHVTKQSGQHAITSCFRSTVPRLVTPRSKTPGPGTYEPLWQTTWLLKRGSATERVHGLFFRNMLEM